MGAIETKTFKDNGKLAVHLPTDMAFPEGAVVRIEKIGMEFGSRHLRRLIPQPKNAN